MEFFINYSIDIVLIIVLVTNIFDSARKGFLRCVLSLVCVFVSLFAALHYSAPAAEWAYDNLLAERIVSEVEEKIDEGLSSEVAADTVLVATEMIPEFLAESIKELGIDIDALSAEISALQLSSGDTALKISEQIIRPGALVLLKLVCYILIYLAVRFVLGLIVGLIDKIPSLPVIGHMNKWLGAALGTVKGVVIVFVLCVLINALASIVKPSEFEMALQSSRICAAVAEFKALNLTEFNFDEIKKIFN